MTAADVEQTKYVTLLGTRIAREGFRFIFDGTTETCSTCRLSSACLSNLEKGRAYQVVEVKTVQHGCELHDGAVTVYVVPVHLEMNIDNDKKAVEGITFAYEPMGCPEISCENFLGCTPTYLKPDDKVRIVKKNNNFLCPKDGKELT
ncbi:MAG: UPF0179 family protein, partial [Candidatus Odinarchaeota archaeon]